MRNLMPEQLDADYIAAMNKKYHRNRMAIALNLLKSVTPLKGKYVFDFGCGEGSFMHLLKSDGAKVSGCDPSQDLSPDVVGGVEVLETLDPVDILCALNVLSYMDTEEQTRFWRLARKVLNPDGYLLIVGANEWAAGTRRKFAADPRTFPNKLAERGFREIARDFSGMYRTPVETMLGFHERITNPSILALFPNSVKARRCTLYYSLSRRD